MSQAKKQRFDGSQGFIHAPGGGKKAKQAKRDDPVADDTESCLDGLAIELEPFWEDYVSQRRWLQADSGRSLLVQVVNRLPKAIQPHRPVKQRVLDEASPMTSKLMCTPS
eukprot:TRINITY_DN8143_c0_g1_i4.p2 TRINITY_DN8143_c0_g1~~TRINITY_DN8143_c0_g1_i4.p2  ORF type:complete len:110 (-),score=11.31 TRINITY_DN8143_c0_g1_i4:1531-1860(-)